MASKALKKQMARRLYMETAVLVNVKTFILLKDLLKDESKFEYFKNEAEAWVLFEVQGIFNKHEVYLYSYAGDANTILQDWFRGLEPLTIAEWVERKVLDKVHRDKAIYALDSLLSAMGYVPSE